MSEHFFYLRLLIEASWLLGLPTLEAFRLSALCACHIPLPPQTDAHQAKVLVASEYER